jgi:hypothetical protein
VVYLYLFFNLRISGHHLHGVGILEKHEALYPFGKAQSTKILGT